MQIQADQYSKSTVADVVEGSFVAAAKNVEGTYRIAGSFDLFGDIAGNFDYVLVTAMRAGIVLVAGIRGGVVGIERRKHCCVFLGWSLVLLMT